VSKLSELPQGKQRRVARVEGADDISQRLLEMGLTPGAQVRMLGAAPLGDPLEVELRGYRLSLRKLEAARVEMEHEPISATSNYGK